MKVRIKLGKGTINLSISSYDFNEFAGESYWDFPPRILKEFAEENTRSDLADQWRQNKEDGNKERPRAMGGDDAIEMLALMATGNSKGNPARFEVEYEGPPYWAFHDIEHAKDRMRDGKISVNDHVEDDVLFRGAMLAREHGVGIGAIVRELQKAEADYEQRWKCKSDALERFFHEIDRVPE
jgi:hypothetical protein